MLPLLFVHGLVGGLQVLGEQMVLIKALFLIDLGRLGDV